jgi:molybdate transport system permease protein
VIEGKARSTLRREHIGWRLLTLPFLLFILIPLLALFLQISPATLFASLNQGQVNQAIYLSLVTSTCSVVLTVLIGTPVAYLLSHRSTTFTRLVDTLVDLPTVLPPAVAGVALLMTFGRHGLVGTWLSPLGIQIPFTSFAVVIAQTFIASPFYIKSAAIGFSSINCELKKAAALDGATQWQVFRFVSVPMCWSSLLSGSVMTWARALGEFGATIIFAGNLPGRTQTMPLAIYIGFEIDMNVALTLSIILIALSFLTLIVLKGFLHRRLDDQLDQDVDY